MRLLDRIDDPRDLKGLTHQELSQLAEEAYPELAVRTAATAGDNGTMPHQTETVTW